MTPLRLLPNDIRSQRLERMEGYSGSRNRLEEGNFRLQMRLIQDNSPTIREAARSGKLSVLGAMLDVSTGRVKFI